MFSFFSQAMAATTVEGFLHGVCHWKSDRPVTFATPFSFEYLCHLDVVRARFFFEWLWMTAVAAYHAAVGAMREQNVGKSKWNKCRVPEYSAEISIR